MSYLFVQNLDLTLLMIDIYSRNLIVHQKLRFIEWNGVLLWLFLKMELNEPHYHLKDLLISP